MINLLFHTIHMTTTTTTKNIKYLKGGSPHEIYL